jgi:hypothetical protein
MACVSAAEGDEPDGRDKLAGLVVRGTMKQMIGYFGTESSDFVQVGDSFEIDLTNLPVNRIDFTRGANVTARSRLPPAIPFSSRLVVKEVNDSQRSQGGSDIRLSTDTPENRTGGKLVIQIRADELKQGFKASIYFYQEKAHGRILCMAEAEGVLGLAAGAAPKEDTANESYVGAAEIYAKLNTALGIKAFMGRRVKLEVVVRIARAVPTVEIVQPGGDVAKRSISAHIFSVGSQTDGWKQGRRLIIKGIVVDEGFGAYMIYLHEAESVN